jgi:NitT/TauT family transport system ATP-binding protein
VAGEDAIGVEIERQGAAATGRRAPVIAARGLSVVFASDAGPLTALADVELAIADGEFVALIGPSGCGKTTLLRAIADLERPATGTLAVNGLTPDEARRRRAYGYVFQAPALFAWRTVRANVTLPLEIMGLPAAEREARAQRNLALVGLDGFARAYPWQLSGGMQQRVSIARALAVEPALLLLDEPFGALDEITRDHLNVKLRELWRRTGKTCVFVTHSIAEAVYLSTRIVVMSPRPGRILEVIDCDLPAERPLDIRETLAFQRIAQRVRDGLRRGHSYED